MKRESWLGEPLIYALIGRMRGGIVSFLFSLGFHSIGLFCGKNNSLAANDRMGNRLGCNDHLAATVSRESVSSSAAGSCISV